MMECINKIICQVSRDEQEHLDVLSSLGGLSTSWSNWVSHNNPGFFSPYTKKMGIKPALIVTGLLPLLKLQYSIFSTLMIPASIVGGIACLLLGHLGEASNCAQGLLLAPIFAVYFSGAFVLNLLKEVTALITRSIATLIHTCLGPSGDEITLFSDTESDLNHSNLTNNSDIVLTAEAIPVAEPVLDTAIHTL